MDRFKVWMLASCCVPVLAMSSCNRELAHIDRVQGSVTNTNGLNINGLNINGLNINGLNINGLNINGLNINGLNINGLNINGQSLNAGQQTDFKDLYSYMAACALPEGETATLYDPDQNGTALVYDGLFGLAPEWKTGPLSTDGAELVSACLAAHANMRSRTVLISLRGAGIPTTQAELDLFTTHEGILWGNFFQPNPEIEACIVDGGGLSGRTCGTSNACGFTFHGPCADVCEFDAGTNSYVSCGANDETNILETWLNFSHRLTIGPDNAAKRVETGEIALWGQNEFGQMATPPVAQSYFQDPTLITSLGADNEELVVHHHGCARKTNGDVWCWGRNDYGQIGDNTRHTSSPYAHPNPAFVIGNVTQVVIGRFHTCALKTSGDVKCWGRNQAGQLGIDKPHVILRKVPKPVSEFDNDAILLSSGTANARHTCAAKTDDSVWCWGNNQNGQLGLGDFTKRYAPVQVATDENNDTFEGVTELCGSKTLTCARKTDGSVWCWGGSGGYQTTRPREYALGPMGLGAAPGGLACGTDWACAVADDSSVWCMGSNDHGQLGYDTGGADSTTMQMVPNLEAVSFVTAGQKHTCAALTDDSVWCWGTDPALDDNPPLPQMYTPTLTMAPQEVIVPAP